MYGRNVLSVYARDLKPGMVTKLNGEVIRNRGVAPEFYHMRNVRDGGMGEPMNIAIRYATRVGVQILAPHDIVELVRL